MRGKFLAKQHLHAHTFSLKANRAMQTVSKSARGKASTQQLKHTMWINFCVNDIVEHTLHWANGWNR